MYRYKIIDLYHNATEKYHKYIYRIEISFEMYNLCCLSTFIKEYAKQMKKLDSLSMQDI